MLRAWESIFFYLLLSIIALSSAVAADSGDGAGADAHERVDEVDTELAYDEPTCSRSLDGMHFEQVPPRAHSLTMCRSYADRTCCTSSKPTSC